MTTEQEMERIVRSWLEPGLTTLTDDVLDAVLDQLPATPQRRPWSVRRIADMNPIAKYAIAATAVVVIAIVGFNLLAPPGDEPAGGVPAPTAAGSPSPDATPLRLTAGELEPGTYVANAGSARFTFTVPDGWRSGLSEFIASKGDTFEDDDSVSLQVWHVSHVYADSCDWGGTLVETRTNAAVTEALAAQVGHETRGPTTVPLGGHQASRVQFSVPADFDSSVCDLSIIRLWPGAGGAENAGLPIAPGQTTTAYVMEVNGSRFVMATVQWEGSSAADIAELEAVLQSLRFEP